MRRKLLAILPDIEFYLKVAIACTLIQQIIAHILGSEPLSFLHQTILLWLIGSLTFYGLGFGIEVLIKRNTALTARLTARTASVKEQAFPAFTASGVVIGEIKAFATAAVILFLAPEIRRGNDVLANFGWFLMSIMVADFCFYMSHWVWHRKPFLKIHMKHHEFQDTSSFVAGHKSWTESIITTFTDLLPIFVFGYDINQILAWVLVGTAYNLEGHSSLSIFFISSDFHDLHHTSFRGNYGIQGFWDKVFNTLNNPAYQRRIQFPASYLVSDSPEMSSSQLCPSGVINSDQSSPIQSH